MSRRKLKRPFTAEETESVELYFASYIEALDKVSLGDCRDFLEQSKLDRKAKDILDKIKNLVNACKREMSSK